MNSEKQLRLENSDSVNNKYLLPTIPLFGSCQTMGAITTRVLTIAVLKT